MATMNARVSALVGTEALARILLRAEAVASSRIEGLEIGARRLLHAEVSRESGEASSDITAGKPRWQHPDFGISPRRSAPNLVSAQAEPTGRAG
jgi:hypothetical protein